MATDQIKIVWRVSDGYAGGDAPHYTRIRATDFEPNASDQEIADQIAEAVQEDFEQNISLDLRTDDVMAAVKAIRTTLSRET